MRGVDVDVNVSTSVEMYGARTDEPLEVAGGGGGVINYGYSN